MGFSRDLIHDVVAVSPFDLKIIITGAAYFAITIILNLFFFSYFLSRLSGFPRIFDRTLLLTVCYTAVCSIVTQRSSRVGDDTLLLAVCCTAVCSVVTQRSSRVA